MLNVICRHNCKSCYAEPVCALHAIVDQQDSIYVDTEKCIGCGCCKTVCIYFGLEALKDKTIEWLKGAG